MKHMIIDGVSCEFENARNVLEVAQKNGIDIPNLCYCENLSIYGGCRMCVVENEKGGIEAACTMVKQICEYHGGSVDVESEPGRGSTFTVRLPLA